MDYFFSVFSLCIFLLYFTVERTYFSAKFPNVCLHCGVDMNDDEGDNWDMYPRCEQCEKSGRPPVPKRSRVFKVKEARH